MYRGEATVGWINFTADLPPGIASKLNRTAEDGVRGYNAYRDLGRVGVGGSEAIAVIADGLVLEVIEAMERS